MTPNTIFENHVFISYAHIDNARFTEIEKGWIERLHEALLAADATDGEPVKIWLPIKTRRVVAERREQVWAESAFISLSASASSEVPREPSTGCNTTEVT